jgi:hypothetical protein
MATKIKDSATAERAALNVQTGIEVPVKAGEPVAPHEKTTTERLFPDFIDEKSGIIANRPVMKESPVAAPSVPATATPASASQGQTPPTQAPTVPTYLKPEELAGKMVKLKVDGIEQDVPADQLVKLNQLERHSNSLLMKVAQERAQLERERQEILSRPVPEIPNGKVSEPQKKAPEIEALEAKMAAMEAQIAQERALMLPQIQEAGIKRVEQMVKERTGFDDYRAYHDKVKAEAVPEAAKAQAAGDINAARFFDSDTFYYQKYQELKLKDLAAKVNAPVPPPTIPNAPVLQTQTGAPVIVNNNSQPVSIPTLEGASGVPARTEPSADWQATYNRLLRTAQETPTDENWMNVMRHKYRAGQ